MANVEASDSMNQPTFSITNVDNVTIEIHATKGPQTKRYYFLYASTVVVIVLGFGLEVIVAWFRCV
jgi:hypothetical protein